MPANKTLSKGASDAQYAAFEAARAKAGLSVNQAKDRAFKLFCESQGVEWPETGRHGGDRKSGKEKGILDDILRCPACGYAILKPIGEDLRNTAHFQCDGCKLEFWNKEHPNYEDEIADHLMRRLRGNPRDGYFHDE